jgi:GNAT superfamily N-acetyltransferase
MENAGIAPFKVREASDFEIVMRGHHFDMEMAFFDDGRREQGHVGDITVDDRFHRRGIGRTVMAHALGMFLEAGVTRVLASAITDSDVWYRCGAVPLSWPKPDNPPEEELADLYNAEAVAFNTELRAILANPARRPSWTNADVHWLRSIVRKAAPSGLCAISDRDDLFVITRGQVKRLGAALPAATLDIVFDFKNPWTRHRLKTYAGLDVENHLFCQRPITPKPNNRHLLKKCPHN